MNPFCFSFAEGHWTNEALDVRTDTSESATPRNSEPTETLQNAPPQTKDNAQSLSHLFSTSSTHGKDFDGHSFFDSLAPTNDPFAQSSQLPVQPQDPLQALFPSQEALPSVSVFQDSLQAQDELEPMQITLDSFQSNQTVQEPLQDSQSLDTPLQPGKPSQQPQQALSVQSAHELRSQPSSIEPLQGLDISKEPRSSSAPPTPEGEELRSKQTEAERRHSAWIASLQTQQLLATIGAGMMSSSDVEQQFLTSPGLVVEGPQVLRTE